MEDNKIQFEPGNTKESKDTILILENGKPIGLIVPTVDEKGNRTYLGYDKQFGDLSIHYNLEELQKQVKEKMKQRRKNRLLELEKIQQGIKKTTITKNR